MSRSKNWNAICLALVAMAAAFLLIRHRTLTALRNQNASSRSQAEQLQNLRAENARLKAQQQSAPVAGLSPDEFRELLRLRGEIGTLRNQLVEGIGSTNLFDAHVAQPGDRASNTWSQVGADTPEAALETLLWALNTTNFNQATGAFHFEVSGPVLRPGAKGVQDNFVDYVGNEMMRHWITNLQSLEIISAVPTENEEVMLKLWETTRDGNRHQVVADVRRVGNEWKFLAGMKVLEVDQDGDVNRFNWRRPFGREKFQREPPTPSQ